MCNYGVYVSTDAGCAKCLLNTRQYELQAAAN